MLWDNPFVHWEDMSLFYLRINKKSPCHISGAGGPEKVQSRHVAEL